MSLSLTFSFSTATFFAVFLATFTGVKVVPISGFFPPGSVTDSFFAVRVVLVLRTGLRGVKIQPTPRTGLPPMRRFSLKSQGYSSWNS